MSLIGRLIDKLRVTPAPVATPQPVWRTDSEASVNIDFYGKPITVLKLFGQTRWGDNAPGRVSGQGIHHAAGVIVDQQDHVYVIDTGNSRVLGYRSFDDAEPTIILGQPDVTGSATNGDCNLGNQAPTSAQRLCLLDSPAGTNLAEQWMYLNGDCDAQGNLVIPDMHNNRVLIFAAPFAPGASQAAAQVIGQPDFTSNGINAGRGRGMRDARSLHISMGGFDHASARGASFDPAGNVWVADTFNHRVLRFPRGSNEANLVLGARDFGEAAPVPNILHAPLDRMCHPTIARLHPGTGELWVIDEYPGGFPARMLVFAPPFHNGMAAARVLQPRQPLQGDYAGGYRWTHATGMQFNTFLSDEFVDDDKRARYRDGVVWVHDSGVRGSRTLLLDAQGEILLAIGATDCISFGCSDQAMSSSGLGWENGFALRAPGGNMGIDAHGRILLADGAMHRIARHQLPYRPRPIATGRGLPFDAGGKFPGTSPNQIGPATFHADRFGCVTHQGQLIVRDHQRYMVWNNYMNAANGSAADVFVGQSDGFSLRKNNHIMGRSTHGIDANNRLWSTGAHGQLMMFELPLHAASEAQVLIPLAWADAPGPPLQYRCNQVVAVDARNNHLWLYDNDHHRLLRARLPAAGWNGDPLLVDCVLGQHDKRAAALNRGMPKPDACSFGDVNDVKFDMLGNMFVVDNTYEGHPNGRVIAFGAQDLAGIDRMFPAINASRVFCVDGFDSTDMLRVHAAFDHPHSPVTVAFNSRNEMVIGNDGYYRDPAQRATSQLYLYRDPWQRAQPDALITLPLGAPGELCFDDADNLIVQDHTWNKVWIINVDRDAAWLRPPRQG